MTGSLQNSLRAALRRRRSGRCRQLLGRLMATLASCALIAASCSDPDAASADDSGLDASATAAASDIEDIEDVEPTPTSASPESAPVTAAASVPTTTGPNAEGHYPRSVAAGEQVVNVARQPMRIAALSTDVAEVVLALVGPERVVAVPEANTNPAIGAHTDTAASVAHHVALGDTIDAALLTGWGVDLVVISPNHQQEAQLASELQGSGIPILTMPNSWDTLVQAQLNINLIGQAVGADAAATQIADDMARRAGMVADRIADNEDRPSVLILTNVAGIPFLIGPEVSTTDLVELAGGYNAAGDIDVEATISPVTAAQIAQAKPDRILLIDGLGTGRQAFNRLLDHDEIAELPAIGEDRILVLPARVSFGVAQNLIDGLEVIADWLHPR